MIFLRKPPPPCRPTPAIWSWTLPAVNNESAKPETDAARVAELNERVNSLYSQIMASEGMVRYNAAKKECEEMVGHIDAIINTAMNGGDPMSVKAPTGGCTGSCSTCGGCPSSGRRGAERP